ncbi:MAG: EAL domain-containing protein [Eubacteriales bacterium]|nr:EAL domain-containing protein [Eubacteriales bacterium]
MNHLVIFSALYLIMASISPVMGAYALRFDRKATLNRLFMVISVCLAFWALGFSIAMIAPDAAAWEFWSRFAAVGYELVYSVLLHFTLILTGHKRILSKKWFYFVLYLPAAFLLYVFVLSPDTERVIYQFANTARGWVRVDTNTVYDLIFQIYYLVTVCISLTLLVLWKIKNSDRAIKKQANILLFSFLIAFGFGTFTDILNGSYFNLPIPLMAPVLFLIPLSAFFYCINKYHFMRSLKENELESILNDERRIAVFRIASYGMILGGISLYIMENVMWRIDNAFLAVFSSAMLIALGGILHYVQRSKKGYGVLELLLIITSLTLTPILTVGMTPLGGMSIWAFPIMLIVCALVFNSADMLLASSIPALLSQVYLSAILPYKEVLIDYRTYISRELILIFIVCAACYIHRVYVGRLKENAAQARTQTLISDIAAGFSLADQADMPLRLRELFVKLADYFSAEIVLMNGIESETTALAGMQQYSVGEEEITLEQKLRMMERWTAYAEQNPSVLDAIPFEQNTVAEQYEKMKATPWLFIPVYEHNKLITFIYIETSRAGTVWTEDQIVSLPVISRIVSDTLAQLSSEMRIRFMAYYDDLTKLPNRQLFRDRAEQAIHLARRDNRIVGVVFLDLDSFKSINDTMGHEGGDLLIQAISRKLTNALRKSDTVARFGGDEFLLLLNGVADVDDISKVADKIIKLFKEPIVLKGQEIFITASAGISVFPVDGEDAETLIKHADIAMYTAKDKGKNQYAFCSTNMKETVKYRVNLSNNLHRALERNELRVYYQPQVDLRTEEISGLEALLRWEHPEYGMIMPLEFIPMAEQTGLINSIGAWVLETACAQVAAWKRMGLGELRIAVNLSVVQLRNPGMVAQVEQILKTTAIDPSQVELEITESVTTKEPDYIIRVLNDLKALGVSISIDDFGTEYSSLNRLKMLPVDRLKMAIQFVHGIDQGPKDRAISLVIMNLAKNLDLKLVAEGVETSTQLDFLKNRMCDEVQGFYYYKPMPAPELEEVLRK